MLTLLALLSGAGLVTLVGWSLYRTAQQGHERAELDARARARDLGQALRAALRSADVLDATPLADRFALHDGQLVVPEPIGWLHTQPRRRRDPRIAEQVLQAQRAEFAHDDAAAAQAHFERLLDDEPFASDATMQLAAAWQAHRAGHSERLAKPMVRLVQTLQELQPLDLGQPGHADVVASCALLWAARGEPWPATIAPLLLALPPELRFATLARLDERGVDTQALRAQAQALERERRTLQIAASQRADLSDQPFVRAHGGELLLWYPHTQAPGHGRGACTSVALLARLVGTAVPDIPGLTFVRPDTEHEAVVPDLAWVVPAAVPPAPWFARPAALIAATSVLLLMFAGSLALSARAVRQQALAMRARSEFLTGVTHELKTPIASIRLVAEVLTDDDVPPAKQREYFALLAGEAARLAMLIDNVLDLGQIERGERNYDLRDGDFAEVVRGAVALFTPLASRAGMTVNLHQGTERAHGHVDAGAYAQALLAVFENARKYAQHGGHLDVHTSIDATTFVVRVGDRGPGVPAAEREAIFARFTRGRAQQHGSVPGVGLGLYLARTIAQRHGGTLECSAHDSPQDHGPGAVFTFRLPLAQTTPS